MRIKNPQFQEEINIYSARLTFTKKKNENGQVKNMVRVVIRYSQRGFKRKKDLKIPDDPEHDNYINTGELEWRRYKGKGSSEYRRTGNSQDYDYEDKGRIRIPIALRHKIRESCQQNLF